MQAMVLLSTVIWIRFKNGKAFADFKTFCSQRTFFNSRCESLAELIWTNRHQIKQLQILKQKLSIDPPGIADVLPQLLADLTQLLSSLVTSTFIIEKQPPQVMKTHTRYKFSPYFIVTSIILSEF